MKYLFENEFKINVRDYITEKQSLYIKAGEKDEDLIVKRIYNELDPTLAIVITLRNNNNTINDFYFKVYFAKHFARA